jgi:hypothetical protein
MTRTATRNAVEGDPDVADYVRFDSAKPFRRSATPHDAFLDAAMQPASET